MAGRLILGRNRETSISVPSRMVRRGAWTHRAINIKAAYRIVAVALIHPTIRFA